MNLTFFSRVSRPRLKVGIPKSLSSGLHAHDAYVHSKPSQDTCAPIHVSHEAAEGEGVAKQHEAKTRLRRGSPEHRAMLAAQQSRIWAQPDMRKKRSAAAKEYWARSDDNHRERLSAQIKEMWASRPELKVIQSAEMVARWKDPEKRDAIMKNSLFRRDDEDDKMRKRWAAFKNSAWEWADNLDSEELWVQYHNAYIHLHLDASKHDPNLHSTPVLLESTRPRKAPLLDDAKLAKLKKTFHENVVSRGLPEFTSREFDQLAEELQLDSTKGKVYLRTRLNMEREVWMRAAAVLRRQSVDVDYAGIPHLAWLEDVGRV